MSVSTESTFAKYLNVRTALSAAIAAMLALMVSALQFNDYPKAYAMLGCIIACFVMYLVMQSGKIADWLKLNLGGDKAARDSISQEGKGS